MLVGANPLPDTGYEGLAAHLMPVHALSGDLALDDGLGGDAGVVLAGHPQRLVAAHAVVADHDVFNGGGKRVAKVQRAGDVGRWHADDKWWACGIGARAEEAAALPPLIEAL